VITQYGKQELNAESFTNEQNTYLDGTPIDDARSNLNKATDVMIHIGVIMITKEERALLHLMVVLDSYVILKYMQVKQKLKSI